MPSFSFFVLMSRAEHMELGPRLNSRLLDYTDAGSLQSPAPLISIATPSLDNPSSFDDFLSLSLSDQLTYRSYCCNSHWASLRAFVYISLAVADIHSACRSHPSRWVSRLFCFSVLFLSGSNSPRHDDFEPPPLRAVVIPLLQQRTSFLCPCNSTGWRGLHVTQ